MGWKREVGEEEGGVVWVKGGDSYSKDTRRTSERLWEEGGNRTSTPKKQQYLPNETERRTTSRETGKGKNYCVGYNVYRQEPAKEDWTHWA